MDEFKNHLIHRKDVVLNTTKFDNVILNSMTTYKHLHNKLLQKINGFKCELCLPFKYISTSSP